MSTMSKNEYLIDLWMNLKKEYQPLKDNNSLRFTELTSFLLDKKITKLSFSFYKILNDIVYKKPMKKNLTNKNELKSSKIMLSALMVIHFPKDIFDVSDLSNLTIGDSECYFAAQKMIEYIFNQNLNEFELKLEKEKEKYYNETLKSIETFEILFEIWKKKDGKKLLDWLKNTFHQWCKSLKVINHKTRLNKESKKDIVNVMLKNKMNVKKKICKFIGNEKGNQICCQIEKEIENEPELLWITPEKKEQNDEKYNETKKMEEKLLKNGIPLKMKSGINLLKEEIHPNKNNSNYIELYKGKKVMNLNKILMDVASKHYWDNFSKEIEQNKYELLFELLKETLERIKTLSPKKDEKYLNQLIDVSFIENSVVNQSIDAKEFYTIFLGIFDQLKRLHAPIYDKSWNEWHQNLLVRLNSKDISWATVLPEIFNKFLAKLDQIESAVEQLKN